MKKIALIFGVCMGICVFFAGHILAYEEGTSNTFFGNGAGASTTQNRSATFIGAEAGYKNDNGYQNTFLGYRAGYYNTDGDYNTFIGHIAGNKNIDGCSNTFIGYAAGNNNSNGRYNTFLGYRSGWYNDAGNYNIFIGLDAGHENTHGSSNIFIGNQAGYYETGSNKLYIENTDSIYPLIYGEFDNDLVKIHGTLEMAEAVAVSDIRMKKNIQPLNAALNKISMLEGVSFEWKTQEYADRGLSDDKQIGLIAQDVEKLLPELVRTGADGYKAISYAKLTAVLVEAVKELEKENQALKAQLEDQIKKQQAQIDKQQAMLEAIFKNRDYSALSINSSICMAAGGAQ